MHAVDMLIMQRDNVLDIEDIVDELQTLQERLIYIESHISNNRIRQVVCCKQEMQTHVTCKNKQQLKCLVCGNVVSLSKKSLRSDKQEGSNKNSSY